MKISWFELNKEDKKTLLEQAAQAGQHFSPTALEKDIYVCWCLREVFSLPDSFPKPIFKGGTSLSKVFNVIHRFSEDIDITLEQGYFTDIDILSNDLSKKRRNKALKELDNTVDNFASNDLLLELQKRANKQSTELEISRGKFQTILVEYDSAVIADSYLKPRVAIELGARNVQEPLEPHKVSPYTEKQFKNRL